MSFENLYTDTENNMKNMFLLMSSKLLSNTVNIGMFQVQESKFPTPQNEISSTSTVCATSSKQIKVTTTTSQVKLSAFYHPVNAHVHVKKEGVLRCIILMLTINGRPFSILEDLGFCTAFGTVLASVN